jgi:hypothetical protein
MPDLWTLSGFLGIGLSGLAYIPQVMHLGKEHCSAGVSRTAWALWTAASILIGAQALVSRNLVFSALQVLNLAASSAIFVLAYRYRGMVCDRHRREFAAATPSSSGLSGGGEGAG